MRGHPVPCGGYVKNGPDAIMVCQVSLSICVFIGITEVSKIQSMLYIAGNPAWKHSGVTDAAGH